MTWIIIFGVPFVDVHPEYELANAPLTLVTYSAVFVMLVLPLIVGLPTSMPEAFVRMVGGVVVTPCITAATQYHPAVTTTDVLSEA